MNALEGRRIVITRPVNKAEEFSSVLKELGAIPIILPTIEISPLQDHKQLDKAIGHLENYDWLILTSANAVNAFWNRMQVYKKDSLPNSLRVAAIGSKTASTLQELGIQADYVPYEYVAEALHQGLGDLNGKRVLLPQADLARDMLSVAIQKAGGIAHPITAYHTIPANPNASGLRALREGVDALTFTSPSTVLNFFSITNTAGLNPYQINGDPIYVCIGPITADAVQQKGIKKFIVAKEYTQEGLISTMQEFFDRNPPRRELENTND
jgi:uroporphyrinogen-III synthase